MSLIARSFTSLIVKMDVLLHARNQHVTWAVQFSAIVTSGRKILNVARKIFFVLSTFIASIERKHDNCKIHLQRHVARHHCFAITLSIESWCENTAKWAWSWKHDWSCYIAIKFIVILVKSVVCFVAKSCLFHSYHALLLIIRACFALLCSCLR